MVNLRCCPCPMSITTTNHNFVCIPNVSAGNHQVCSWRPNMSYHADNINRMLSLICNLSVAFSLSPSLFLLFLQFHCNTIYINTDGGDCIAGLENIPGCALNVNEMDCNLCLCQTLTMCFILSLSTYTHKSPLNGIEFRAEYSLPVW